MFNQTRYGRYSQKNYHNNASATIKILAFVAVVVFIGGGMWALFQAANTWTAAVGNAWNATNNDSLIHVLGSAIADSIKLLAGVIGLVIVGAIAPWFIRNFRMALLSPIPGVQREYNVLDAEHAAPGLLETDEQPAHGLLVAADHREHYIGAEHQLVNPK
jgi:hypothetical protein